MPLGLAPNFKKLVVSATTFFGKCCGRVLYSIRPPPDRTPTVLLCQDQFGSVLLSIALLKALEDFNGCVVFASLDRNFRQWVLDQDIEYIDVPSHLGLLNYSPMFFQTFVLAGYSERARANRKVIEIFKPLPTSKSIRMDEPIAFEAAFVETKKIFNCDTPLLKKNLLKANEGTPASYGPLRQKIVVLNLNTKNYYLGGKAITNVWRYRFIVQLYRELGFSVLVCGGAEIEFARQWSNCQVLDFRKKTINEQIDLVSDAHHIVSSTSGFENFCLFANVPLLNIECVELTSLVPARFVRFLTKPLVDNNDKVISLHELLRIPKYFDLGSRIYQTKELRYADWSVEVLKQAVIEFINLVDDGDWLHRSSSQNKFESEISLKHLDLYEYKEFYVPLNVGFENFCLREGRVTFDRD